ncbi:MAG TPA: hypothetical protein DCL43_03760, partial [Chitinophagaceae bacterium]|nr:hypothetical protein [Chitinophagaceae bacterium]
MNYKYLGNALDLFKYDFITYLTRKSNAELFYIPMWTTPEKKQRDPKYALYEVGRYNTLLMDFLKKANEDNSIIQLSDVITFLKQEGVILNYITQDINLSNSGLYIADSHAFFTGEKVFRDLYFNQACQYLLKNKNKKLIFIDPDVGIDNGTSQRFRKCPQMYFTISELKCVLKNKG